MAIINNIIVKATTLLFTNKNKADLCFIYSTVTDFAKLRGWSTSVPLIKAT